MRQQMLSQESTPRMDLPRGMRAPERIVPPRLADGSDSPGWPRLNRRAWLPGAAGLSSGGVLEGPGDRAQRRDPLLALVHRITQGFTLAEYERAKALGFEAYLEEQLDPLAIDDSVSDGLLASYPVLGMSPKEVYDSYSFSGTAHRELKAASVGRAVNSKRQLLERMVEFWCDHFNIDHNKGLEWVLLPEHLETVIRPHAMGSFPELLSATAFSGAMLFYLDNWLNVLGAPQENYARELMELHTLSVNGGYDETDIDEVAKCFTGWTLEGDYGSPDYLRGKFEPSYHEGGSKTVLGVTIPANPGIQNAQRVLDILVAHPSTAQFLAWKLVRWFLTPTPPQALVDEVAAEFQATGGDIQSMLRKILTKENLSASIAAPKYRRPFHLLISHLRALEVSVRDGRAMVDHLASMGHSPYDFEAPTGYPDDFTSWGRSLLPRWTFSSRLLRPNFVIYGMRLPSFEELQVRLSLPDPNQRAGLAKRVNQRLLGLTLPREEEELLQGFIDGYPRVFDRIALYDCLVLASSLPGNQWC